MPCSSKICTIAADVFFELERIGSEPALVYMGRDAHGNPIHRSKGSRKTPGTVNRFRNALSGVFNWAIRPRRLPKGTLNPCHAVKKHPEHPGIVRFLDDDERVRLLAARRASSWPRLYALVLMGITTGGRRSELCGLRWRHVDLERRQAGIITSKNDESRVLPLTKAVVDELTRFRAEDAKRFKLALSGTLVFHSDRKPDRASSSSPYGGPRSSRPRQRLPPPRSAAHHRELSGASRCKFAPSRRRARTQDHVDGRQVHASGRSAARPH
jgi:integrase